MQISAVVAQFPVRLDIRSNLSQIERIIEQCTEDELVVLPEGSLSGYSDDTSFLAHVDLDLLNNSLDTLQKLVMSKRIHLFVGACILEDGKWKNAAIYMSPTGERFTYRKVNLATHERGPMAPGDELSIITLDFHGEKLRVGIQLCREIKYPEQWNALAKGGAEVIVYMTHCIENKLEMPVWRSLLISHAASNQRFVLASNTAHSEQLCPTMIVDPKGMVLKEEVSDQITVLRQVIDTSKVSNWYISQARTGVATVTYE